jgi:O-antigen/teichoic acid export membrane protein
MSRYWPRLSVKEGRACAGLVLAPGRVGASVAVLAGGTALAQALTVLASPMLTRLFTPDDLGRLGLYMAFVNVAVIGTSLRYDAGIVAGRTPHEAAYLTVIALVTILPVSALMSMGLLFLINARLLGFEALPASASALVLVSLVVTGATSALRFWFVRQETFGLLARVLIWQNGVRSMAQVGLGISGLGWPGLLLGDVAGRLVGVSRLFRVAWASLKHEILPLDWMVAWQVVRQYRKLPIYDLPSSVIDTLAVSLTVPLVAQTYGAESAGYVSLVLAVQTLPVGLLGRSVADVFHARMALYARSDRERILRFFMATTGVLLLCGVGPTALLMVLGPVVFPWLFGPVWTTAGQLAAEMAPWALASLVVSPVSRVVVIFQAQELKLIYDLVALAGVIGPLLIGGALRLELPETIGLLTLAQVAAYALYFVVLLYVVHHQHSAAGAAGRGA